LWAVRIFVYSADIGGLKRAAGPGRFQAGGQET